MLRVLKFARRGDAKSSMVTRLARMNGVGMKSVGIKNIGGGNSLARLAVRGYIAEEDTVPELNNQAPPSALSASFNNYR